MPSSSSTAPCPRWSPDHRGFADGSAASWRRWHGAKDVELPANITLLSLPPCSPELNPVENVWHYLRQNRLAISVFDSYQDIVEKCCLAWNFFANDKVRVASITHRDWAKINL